MYYKLNRIYKPIIHIIFCQAQTIGNNLISKSKLYFIK